MEPLEQKEIKGGKKINNRRLSCQITAASVMCNDILKLICTNHFSFGNQRREDWFVCRNLINEYVFCG